MSRRDDTILAMVAGCILAAAMYGCMLVGQSNLRANLASEHHTTTTITTTTTTTTMPTFGTIDPIQLTR